MGRSACAEPQCLYKGALFLSKREVWNNLLHFRRMEIIYLFIELDEWENFIRKINRTESQTTNVIVGSYGRSVRESRWLCYNISGDIWFIRLGVMFLILEKGLQIEVQDVQKYCSHIFFINNRLDAQFFFMYVYFYSLHVSGSHVPIIRGINCINTTSGICHSV